jgi:NTP pyrophosphatase (non-canonical NTP hydrolase)
MSRVADFFKWAVDTFGPIAQDPDERVARFVEEAVELAHAAHMPREKLERLIERCYSRPRGDLYREMGQAIVTLELYGASIAMDTEQAAEDEWTRVRSIPKDEWNRRHDAKVALGIASN